MGDKFPQTFRDDVSPSSNPGFKAKYGQESFNEPMNPLNAPAPLRKGGNTTANGWNDENEQYEDLYEKVEERD